MLPHESFLSPTSSFNVKDSHKELPSRGVARSRSVNFTPEKEQVVVEFDMVTEEERDTFWYSTDEYQIIKARNSLIVKMMKTGQFREGEHSFRGLEHKLREGYHQRHANKFNGLNAVLEEQDRQYAMGMTRPEAIAEKYRRVSLNAMETAFVVGMRDFQSSYCYSESTSKPINSHNNHLTEPELTSEEPNSMDEGNSDRDFHRPDMMDDDTIASEESAASQTRNRIRGLFNAVSMVKQNNGEINRRTSL